MFSKLARQVMKKNSLKCKKLYNQCRNLTWEFPSKSYKKIGLEKDTVSIYEGITSIKFNGNKNIKKGDVLFEVESNTNINNKFKANDDCTVIEKNENVMKTLNKDPENNEKSWILKISDTKSYGTFIIEKPNTSRKEKKKDIKKFLDNTYIVPYNYYNNSIDKDLPVLPKKKNVNNVNEQDLIHYIIGNH